MKNVGQRTLKQVFKQNRQATKSDLLGRPRQHAGCTRKIEPNCAPFG